MAVIGAGFAGLGAGIRLREAGMTDFVILERAGAVGGTWRDNTYPGCTCDVPSHLYSYSFAPNPDWSHSFSRQPEIQAYLDAVTDRYGMRPYIRFGTELAGARWDAGAARWRLRTSRGDLTADVVIAAAGPLSTPSTPDIPGLGTFPGEIFHSARWDHRADLAGKRVAVIGTGASAIQIVPAIQPVAAGLTLFQRTPAWVMPRRDRRITDAEKWLYRQVPATERLVRAGLHASREALVVAFVKQPALFGTARRIALRHLDRAVPDPDLRARLTPGYMMGCKRILLSNDYYPALTQPNTELVAAGPGQGGREHAHRPGRHRPRRGRDRVRDRVPRHRHAAGPQDHRGGRGDAGRGLGRGHARAARHHDRRVPEPLPADRAEHRPGAQLADPHHRGPARLHAGLPGRAGPAGRGGPGHPAGRRAALVRRRGRRMASTVWATGGCASWYLNAAGRNPTLGAGSVGRFRRATRRVDLAGPQQVDGWLAAAELVLDEKDLTEIAGAITSSGAGTGPVRPG